MSQVIPEIRGYDSSITRIAIDPNRPIWFDVIDFANESEGFLSSSVPIAGLLVQNQPVQIAPTASKDGTLISTYADIFYNRIIFTPQVLDLGAISSTQQRDVVVFNAFFNSVLLIGIANNNLSDISISGQVVPTLFNAIQELTYTVNIGSDGPPNIAGNFTFDFAAPTEDFVLPVNGSRIILFPYIPSTGMTENLNFLTQVLTANDGTEQVIRNRKAPRQSFELQAYIPPTDLSRADNLFYLGRSRLWAFPVWSEARKTTSDVVLNDQVINVNTEYGDFRQGALAIIWQNERKFDLFEIESLTTSQINIERGIIDNFSDAFVVPVRTAIMPANPRRTTSGYDAIVTARMQVLDNIELTTVASPDQFLGLDVFLTQPEYVSIGAPDTYRQRIDINDFDTGAVTIHAPWNNSKIDRNFGFILDGLMEIWEFRLFLHRRAGRQRPFYMPTFENNFQIQTTGLILSTFNVRNNDFALLVPNRVHIAIALLNGAWLFRTITSSSTISSTVEQITIDSDLSVDASEIDFISYLGQKRFAGDTTELTWLANNVATTEVTIREILP